MVNCGIVTTIAAWETSLKFVIIEVKILKGLPAFVIGGLAGKAIQEAKDRIKTAFIHSGLQWPNGKIIVNLQPAAMYKQGTHYDLPIALAIWSAANNKIIDQSLIIFGELSLFGEVLTTRGLLNGIRLIPDDYKIVCGYNKYFGLLQKEFRICTTLQKVITFILDGQYSALNTQVFDKILPRISCVKIQGQDQLLRALIIGCTGRHHMAFIGAPGVGKSFFAKLAPELLPNLSQDQLIELLILYDMSGESKTLTFTPPYSAPHSSISLAGLIGGGTNIKPGAISLAHQGILHLDEINQFPKYIIESLRSPLEDKKVTIIRSNLQRVYSCDFQMIITANPCKCGEYLERNCGCKNILDFSGPIDNRIDMKVFIQRQPVGIATRVINLNTIRSNILLARAKKRQQDIYIKKNNLTWEEFIEQKHKKLAIFSQNLCNEYQLSLRSYKKLWQLAYTISNYDNKFIDKQIILEAFNYLQPAKYHLHRYG